MRSTFTSACNSPSNSNPLFHSYRKHNSAPNVHSFSRCSRQKSSSNLRRICSQQEEVDVVIVGAGLAGLAAAKRINEQKTSEFLVLEASDGIGGRVRTDLFQGFKLDRGFQIFISAYPEAQKVLDYESLHLKKFYSGAMVRYDGKFHRVADPFRHLTDALASLFNPIGSPFDKLLVGLMRLRAVTTSFDDLLTEDEVEIRAKLDLVGFSEAMIDRFFRPFFGGIFFDRDLQTSSRLFGFVLKCLAMGSNTLPSNGIGEIAQQLAKHLPQGSILLNSKVEELFLTKTGEGLGAKLESGKIIKCRKGIVLAVEGPEAAKLLKKHKIQLQFTSRAPRSTICLYFAAEKVPTNEPVLFLNGSSSGIINNMFFPSNVCPSYAPPGRSLVSVTLVGKYPNLSDSQLEEMVRLELGEWFGGSFASTLEMLRIYRIPYAQPDQRPPTVLKKEVRLQNGLYVCGDHQYSSTFDGALASGSQAAEAFLRAH